MNDIRRIAHSNDLEVIFSSSERLGLNCRVRSDLVDRLDPDGVHVLQMIINDHQALLYGGLPKYHRVMGFLKLKGEVGSYEVLFDVLDTQWTLLETQKEFSYRTYSEDRLMFDLRMVMKASEERVVLNVPDNAPWTET